MGSGSGGIEQEQCTSAHERICGVRVSARAPRYLAGVSVSSEIDAVVQSPRQMFLTRPLTAARVLKNAGPQQARHRTFFTPPSLPSFLSSPSDEPQTYHERKLFPYVIAVHMTAQPSHILPSPRYRPSQLYNVVSDVASYPKFIPYCTNTRILHRSQGPPGSVVKMDAEMTARFMAFEASYTSHVTCKPYEFVQVCHVWLARILNPHQCIQAVASSSSPIFKSLTTTWRFQPASPGSPHASNATALSNPVQPIGTPTSSSDGSLPPDQGPTLVSLDLSFQFAHAAYAGASQLFFGQVSNMMISAFEKRCLELYGPGSR